jgi:citrate lyase subunit beta/citryl-CoA lyase
MTSPVAQAKSLLFIPASRPERFAKAFAAGADCVILDLEDAVSPEEKPTARKQLPESLAGFTRAKLQRTLVRINAAGTDWHDADAAMLREWIERGLAGVMLPKSETVAALHATTQALGPSALVVPLVETLAGLDAVDLLASAPQGGRIAFGHLDFQLDLGMRCGPEELELGAVRFALVAASRRAGLPAPVDGVTVDTSDRKRLLQDTHRARAHGFGAKLCIHPAQVAVIHDVFLPTPAEVEWARRVLVMAEARDGAVFSMDGRMVDQPVITLAERTLKQAGESPIPSQPSGANQ